MSHARLERKGTAEGVTLASPANSRISPRHTPPSSRERAFTASAPQDRRLSRTPARISARGSTFSRGGVPQRSEKKSETQRFTSIHGITASDGTHNSEERNTNNSSSAPPPPPPPHLPPLLSARMAQSLPIRFQEHLQVKPWLSARRR